MISQELQYASRVLYEARKAFESVSDIVRWVLEKKYQVFRGHYHDEMAAWAEARHFATKRIAFQSAVDKVATNGMATRSVCSQTVANGVNTSG